ncbi:hypothetical protein Pla123a_22200 [Posidoniimonas polymericola]|uniref:Uncharacterized protein n=1 Tax=Posidoniimonas polymericola TaxID=2528002 RepID=A0A5C5YRN8_9BACT|nr:hypothetical protein [Posidoniimonas polymericola]TWT77559.1 hypothetical protein Pla123a_22200 [Posidoniimonas polymericola]
MARFTLFDLMFLTAATAVVCDGFAYHEGWGTVVMMLVVPVAGRTLLALQRRAERSLPTSVQRKSSLLLTSLGVVLLVYLGVVVWVGAMVSVGNLAKSPVSAAERLRLVGLALFPLMGLLGVTDLTSRWVGRRWERDTTCE